MGLKKLWEVARPIPKEIEFLNKYTWMGFNKVIPIKYLDVNDVMRHDLPISNYVIKNEFVLLIPNIINGHVVDIHVQPMEGAGQPLRLGSNTFPYNIGRLSPSFKYGDPIVLVEGVADLAAIKLMNKDLNVCAMRGNSLSKDHIKLLSTITNNIIVIPDADEAGEQGFKRLWYRFRDFKVSVVSIGQYKGFKDTGDFIDRLIQYFETDNPRVLDEIQLAWKYYEVAIETERRNMR